MTSRAPAAFVALAILGACGAPTPATHPSVVPQVVDAGPVADAAPLADAEPPLPPATGYLKGQLHLHSAMSGDSNTAPNDVVRFYGEHGYDFIVFTDHNWVTEMLPRAGDLLVIPGVELTHSTTDCDPPPEKKKCLVHMNALFVDTPSPVEMPVAERTSNKRLDLYLRYIDGVRALGGLAMLNHPNFGWTVDVPMAVAIGQRGVRLFEFANQGMPISNPGDATHMSSEAMWDAVLSAGVRMWGVASDDAHHYYDVEAARSAEVKADLEEGRDAGVDNVYPADRGWVMVLAAREPKAIRQALERGEFYASTGVTFATLAVEGHVLVVEVAGQGPFRIECIGERGRVLAEVRGARARCARPAGSSYVRARVTDAAGRNAWTQPVFRE